MFKYNKSQSCTLCPVLTTLAIMGVLPATANTLQRVTANGQQVCLIDKGDSVGHRRLPGSTTGAIITNGVIKMGVTPEGALNVINPGGVDSGGVTDVGLRYIFPNGSESEVTAAGCSCEGWGVGMDGVPLYFNMASGSSNPSLYTTIFTSDASTATSTVTMANKMRVTHDYRPSAKTPNAYEVKVTLENLSGDTFTDVPYRRVFDFDVWPTRFSECVTINGDPSSIELVTNATNNGFADANPYVAPGGTDAPLVNHGPMDQGACVDFQFGPLVAGATREFSTYYGGASSEEDALSALADIGAELYALGKPNSGGSCSGNISNTFLFAFAEVGGDVLLTNSPTASSAPTNSPTASSAPSEIPTGTPTTSRVPRCVPDLFEFGIEFGNCTKPLTFEECKDAANTLGHKWISNPIDPSIMDKPFDHVPGGCFAKRKNRNGKIIKVRYNAHDDPSTNCGQNTKDEKFTKLCVCCV